MMSATDRIKVLVLGDSGVGKTSLVHLICHNQTVSNASWTIGTSIEIKLHEYQEGTPNQRSTFIELWDVGGSRSHFTARPILFHGFHGLILVHDLSNRKSQGNLRKWLSEVFFRRDFSSMTGLNSGGIKEGIMNGLSAFMGSPPSFDEVDFDPEAFAEKSIPVLVVGTKLDQSQGSYNPDRRNRASSVASECNAEEILIDCMNIRSFAPASTNAVHLCRFFDKVIDKKYRALDTFQERQRRKTPIINPVFGINKMSHLD
jgi:Rab-like protein 3